MRPKQHQQLRPAALRPWMLGSQDLVAKRSFGFGSGPPPKDTWFHGFLSEQALLLSG